MDADPAALGLSNDGEVGKSSDLSVIALLHVMLAADLSGELLLGFGDELFSFAAVVFLLISVAVLLELAMLADAVFPPAAVVLLLLMFILVAVTLSPVVVLAVVLLSSTVLLLSSNLLLSSSVFVVVLFILLPPPPLATAPCSLASPPPPPPVLVSRFPTAIPAP